MQKNDNSCISESEVMNSKGNVQRTAPNRVGRGGIYILSIMRENLIRCKSVTLF